MAISIKLDPINRDIELLLNESFSPKARSLAFAELAKEQIGEAKETNRRILGRAPRLTVSVDGRLGLPIDQVRHDGVIVAEFELFNDTLAWIGDQLELHSPVGGKGDRHPGLYKRSHVLFADGVETVIGEQIPAAKEFVFLNVTPYARKIETGSSSQAPDGVYQAVAILARRRFGNVAKISFAYRAAFAGTLLGGRAGNKSAGRQPAIVVTLGDR